MLHFDILQFTRNNPRPERSSDTGRSGGGFGAWQRIARQGKTLLAVGRPRRPSRRTRHTDVTGRSPHGQPRLQQVKPETATAGEGRTRQTAGEAARGSHQRKQPMARRADPERVVRVPKHPPAGLRRSDRFLLGLHAFDRVVFVSHVSPDPDSLGSMLGLAHLVETRLDKPTAHHPRRTHQPRREPALVEVLHLDLVPIEEVQWRHERRGGDGGQPAAHRPAHVPGRRAALRGDRPPRHARRPRRRRVHRHPLHARGDVLARDEVPDGTGSRRSRRRSRPPCSTASRRKSPATRARPARPTTRR